MLKERSDDFYTSVTHEFNSIFNNWIIYKANNGKAKKL